ncbi:MAG: hypothetical protein ABI740_10340 [Alphaproteobacteria bacterium]
MGYGLANTNALQLREISPESDSTLVFRFDSPTGAFDWAFEPGTIAEFLALLLGGDLRPGRGVLLPDAAISVTPCGKVGAAALHLKLGPVDLISALDPAALEALAVAIASTQAASGKR